MYFRRLDGRFRYILNKVITMRRLILLVILTGFVFFTFISIVPAEDKEGQRKVRVLIVTGQDYPSHKWRQTTPALREALAADKRFEVHVVEDPHFLDSSALDGYDLLVLHFMNWKQASPGEKARANLKKFVEGGKGLFLVHFACGAFQGWPEFPQLAGRVWDPNLRGHDKFGPFTVEIANDSHPITRGLKDFETTDELYTCLAGEKEVEVLATARSNEDGKDYMMAFSFTYGKGRVFHSPLGHDAEAISNLAVSELFRRGAAWAVGLSGEELKDPVD